VVVTPVEDDDDAEDALGCFAVVVAD